MIDFREQNFRFAKSWLVYPRPISIKEFFVHAARVRNCETIEKKSLKKTIRPFFQAFTSPGPANGRIFRFFMMDFSGEIQM